MTEQQDGPGRAGRDVWVLLLLVLVGALVPALLAATAGLAEVPRNDDWSYRSITRHLFETGELRLDGASQSFAVGQVVATIPLLWLLGGHEVAFFTIGVLFAVLAVIAGYGLAREFLGRFDASLVVLALLVAPGYAAYASSFMTDVPALALVLCCLLCGVRAVRRTPVALRWVCAAAVTGALAFSVRQFALAAPVAVALAVILAAPRRGRSWGIGILVVGASVSVALLQASLGGQVGSTPIFPGGWQRVAAIVPSVALFLVPVTLRSLYLRRGLRGRIPLALGVVVAFAVAMPAFREGTVTLGNLLSRWGLPERDYLVGGRPAILGPEGWLLLQLVALASAVALVDASAKTSLALRRARELRHDEARQRRGLAVVAIFTVITAGGLLAYSTLWAFFDRYLWPLLVPMGILLLYVGPLQSAALDPDTTDGGGITPARIIPGVATLAVALVAGAYALNSFAFDGARWRAGEGLVALGERAEYVDAGYEWLGTHGPPPARMSDRQVRPPDPLVWYGNIWPNFTRCSIVSGAPLDVSGFEALATERPGYRQFLFAGPEVTLYLYRSTSGRCMPGAELSRGHSHG